MKAYDIRTRDVNGRELSYIEGWHAIAEVNRIFGFDSWNRETVESRCVLSRDHRGSFQALYIAKVRVSVRADDKMIVREGFGTGEAHAPSPGEAHDKAIKTAETDATKRALATFGKPFGLSLYLGSRRRTRETGIPDIQRQRTLQKFAPHGRYYIPPRLRPSPLDSALIAGNSNERNVQAAVHGSKDATLADDIHRDKGDPDFTNHVGPSPRPELIEAATQHDPLVEISAAPEKLSAAPEAFTETSDGIASTCQEAAATLQSLFEGSPDLYAANKNGTPLNAAPHVSIANAVPNTDLSPGGMSLNETLLLIERPRRRREPNHLKYVASQPCLVCSRTPSDAHHLKFAQPKALSKKVSDEFTVPLCRIHHRQLHHAGNEIEWWMDTDIDPLPIARDLWEQSKAKKMDK